MQIPREIIKMATNAGWSPVTHECYDWRNEEPANLATMPEIALDPAFWQALGKSVGWLDSTWSAHALLFFSLILQGQPADSFWQEILK